MGLPRSHRQRPSASRRRCFPVPSPAQPATCPTDEMLPAPLSRPRTPAAKVLSGSYTPDPLPCASAHETRRSEPFASSCPPALPSRRDSDTCSLGPSSQSSALYCLSMALDGRAEITQATAPPSPQGTSPTAQDPPRPSVLLPYAHLPDAFTPVKSVSRPPRLRRGRSSDVHAWEACASSENREDPLIRQAEHESSGSAIAAITLARSTSFTNSGTLERSSGNGKRRVTMGRAAGPEGVAKRTKFSASSSSRAKAETALTQSQRHNIRNRAPNAYAADVPKTSRTLITVSGNDSDKENWSPDEDGNARSFRAVNSTRTGTITSSGRRPLPSGPASMSSKLDSSRDAHPRRTPMQASSRRTPSHARFNTSPGSWANFSKAYQSKRKPALQHSQSAGLEIYEDEDAGDDDDDDGGNNARGEDDEVRRFMMAGTVSPSKEKDVAAATGLLSLKWGR